MTGAHLEICGQDLGHRESGLDLAHEDTEDLAQELLCQNLEATPLGQGLVQGQEAQSQDHHPNPNQDLDQSHQGLRRKKGW